MDQLSDHALPADTSFCRSVRESHSASVTVGGVRSVTDAIDFTVLQETTPQAVPACPSDLSMMAGASLPASVAYRRAVSFLA